MRRGTLGERLRAIVLATPFVAAMAGVGCNPMFGPCMPPDASYRVALWLLPDGGVTDGGAYWESPGVANGVVLDGNGILDAGCFGICNAPSAFRGEDLYVTRCQFEITDSGIPSAAICTGTPGCPGGRAPFTLVTSTNVAHFDGGHPVGTFFARAARFEAASVHAFRILARELRAHGAPTHLIGARLARSRQLLSRTPSKVALGRPTGPPSDCGRHGTRGTPRSRLRSTASRTTRCATPSCHGRSPSGPSRGFQRPLDHASRRRGRKHSINSSSRPPPACRHSSSPSPDCRPRK
jgi:hypothetical protein